MKPASVLIFSLLLSPIAISAQNAPALGTAGMEGLAPAGASPSVLAVPRPDGCPISLSAQHLSDGDLVQTGFAHPKGMGQALHLTAPSSSHGAMTEATILLHGWTPKGHLSQAASDVNSNATRSRDVKFVPGPDQSANVDLWVAGLSAVTSIEVVSAKFNDGSSWTHAKGISCRVQPDLLMQVHP